MLERFIRHVHESGLLDFSKYYLLAISAGVDSVCLAHLLKRSKVSFGLIHCNFRLRGSDSDSDEAFVRDLAADFGIPVEVKQFDVAAYKHANGVSTQMAARDLRYAWFEGLLKAGQADGILLAHHAGDQVETVLLNLLRGTGIEGTYGMAERRGVFIRPLLPFNRQEIMEYVREEGITWREDSSNEQSDYKRNYLRNEVLPLLELHFSGASEALLGSFARIKDTGQAFFHLWEAWKRQHVLQEEEMEFLEVSQIQDLPGRSSMLYYWLRSYGFNIAQIEEVLEAVDKGTVGIHFVSGDYLLNIDRNQLILGPKREVFVPIALSRHEVAFELDGQAYDLLALPAEGVVLDRSSHNAMLDRDSLSFPLTIRPWQEGDRFRPLGMKHFKKVSDFLIDLKVPLIRKQHVRVLCSGEDIAWVIGYRVDDRFKVGSFTREVLYVKAIGKHV
ncbi:MAG: tRNA lysidine(34) synthetase TilS [Lunatimonas sp.]|uniref:tRNA lysidine(34) synthetase TilS n=1 Tax=Lunatimonas sp. TaxID=2060141 RepID=UPI00263A9D27|nr:tRNA lysidine(34) synthetase TilS [Lunatimonas sp.]MCC5935964.1 tRNA lysidine(34) synthetase TilS [Lunatimonas sp.]